MTVVPARLGNYEFVMVIINVYPLSLMTIDNDGHNIFQRAAKFHNERVLNLLREHVYITEWAECYKDPRHGNKNILHFAGPSSLRRASGAALQMQRELQWFKAVESLVDLSLQDEELDFQTPKEYFTEQHKELVKAGDDWMRTTATSCSVVAALIITVAFAAAFAAPGGNDSDEVPNFLNDPALLIVASGDALALFSSTASVLMFLGILTLRYAEDDFLESLPRKLILGLIMLFFSIATMMVAYGAALHQLLVHRMKWVWLPISVAIVLSVSLFAGLQFPLLVDMIHSTYFSKFLKPNKKGLHNV